MTTTAPVAGWYPDPLDPNAHRYWNGAGWTEQTTPVPAPAPIPVTVAPSAEPVHGPFPQAPTTQVPIQQAATQHAPVQQAPTQQAWPQQVPQVPSQQVPVPQTAYAMPAQHPFPSDPYAVQRGVMRPGQARSLYLRRAPGPSTASRVLIGVGIAVGCFLVLVILAGIAIPVFLNQRAKTHDATASPSTSGTATAIVMPQTAAGLVRSDSTASRQLTQQWMALPLPGAKSVAIYADAAGRPRSAVMVTRVDLSATDQSEFIRGAKSGTAAHGVTAFHTVRQSGGGQMQCASMVSSNTTICLFADSKVGGAIDVFGTTSGDATAVRMRQAIEQGL